MRNWSRILSDLVAMAAYFDGCAKNAGKGTAAEEQFRGYIMTLEDAQEIVLDAMEGEDDGK